MRVTLSLSLSLSLLCIVSNIFSSNRGESRTCAVAPLPPSEVPKTNVGDTLAINRPLIPALGTPLSIARAKDAAATKLSR